MRSLCFLLSLLLLCNVVRAQSNPVPLINNPLVPSSAVPGGSAFTLKVNGTGFRSGAVVKWNGSVRSTTFISQGQLQASITSADIALANTASVIVTNPGGTVSSNIVYFTVTPVRATVSFSTSTVKTSDAPVGLDLVDLNHDGILDLVTVNFEPHTVSVQLGNGDGTFMPPINSTTANQPFMVSFADFNGDGNLDMAVTTEGNFITSILLGNGDGTFQPHVDYSVASQSVDFPAVIADFNGDGKLDLVVPGFPDVSLLLGNGDGTFQPFSLISSDAVEAVQAGDFNEDGKLDLVMPTSSNTLALLLGNGDGTFQPEVDFPLGNTPFAAAVADLNLDGHLDVVVLNIGSFNLSVLLGNGDGTFQPQSLVTVGKTPQYFAAADMNGDGLVDLSVTDLESPLSFAAIGLGLGDGSFQPAVLHDAGLSASTIKVGDLNNDGMLDLVVSNNSSTAPSVSVLLQDKGTVVSLSPVSLTFGTQLVGTVSPPQNLKLTNTGPTSITISKISTTSPNFSQSNNCGTSVGAGASCTLSVYLTPIMQGALTADLTVYDSGGGSPQLVTLAGTGTVVQLSRSSIDFGSVPVGMSSKPERVILTNRGATKLNIGLIKVVGSDSSDFSQVNACGSGLAPGQSCEIEVTFTPTTSGVRNATLGITDGGGGSPQKVKLMGTGT